MQRARFPLYLKILSLFSANVILLATVLLLLVRSEYGLGPNSMLNGRPGERIQKILNLISQELDSAGQEGWATELGQFSDAFGVTFALYRSDGSHVSGTELALTDGVVERLSNKTVNEASDGISRSGAPQPLFLTKDEGYWLAARVHLRAPAAPGASGLAPDVLLAHSGRRGGNDLFTNPLPLIATCIGVVILCALFWVPFVRGVTGSLGKIRDATHEIAARDFETKVEESRSDEIGQLGQSINLMSDRLKGFVDGQRRFLGDIAHELCSPIARTQMAIGVLEQHATDEQRPRVEDVREELQHMADMVNELLSFSKASLQPDAANMIIVVLAPLLHEVAEREIGYRDAEIGLEHSDGLAVVADRELLSRALGNLLRNAMRYAGDEEGISLDARQDGHGMINITVRDFGPGVPEEDLPHLLDPFYRPDKARTRERGGTGLGLAIVKSCIEACGGSVSYRNADPGFEVTLTLKAPRFG